MSDRVDMQPANDTVVSGAEYRQRRKAGIVWHAPSGAAILVRRLDISDHVVINQFPENLRNLIYAAIGKSAKLSVKDAEVDTSVDPFDGMDGEQVLRAEAELGINMCRIGWMNPRVVDKPEDELADDEVRPEDIDVEDRRAFVQWVYTGQRQEAAQLTTFPERPFAGVDTRSDGEAVQPQAEQHHAVGGTVLRPDAI